MYDQITIVYTQLYTLLVVKTAFQQRDRTARHRYNLPSGHGPDVSDNCNPPTSYNFDLFRTRRTGTSSFCTVAWQLA